MLDVQFLAHGLTRLRVCPASKATRTSSQASRIARQEGLSVSATGAAFLRR
jgi:hypothetical protein